MQYSSLHLTYVKVSAFVVVVSLKILQLLVREVAGFTTIVAWVFITHTRGVRPFSPSSRLKIIWLKLKPCEAHIAHSHSRITRVLSWSSLCTVVHSPPSNARVFVVLRSQCMMCTVHLVDVHYLRNALQWFEHVFWMCFFFFFCSRKFGTRNATCRLWIG